MVYNQINSLFLIIFILKQALAAEKLVLTDLTGVYTSSQISWKANNVYLCGATDFTEFANATALGWFGYGNNSTSKNFTNLPPHWSITVRFELILYQSLDPNDYIYVNINGQTDTYQKDGWWLGYYFCYLNNYYYDEIVLFHKNFTSHTDSFINILVWSITDEVIQNEGFGLKNLYISVDTCHDSCLSCNGPAANQCLSCPSNSTQNGNTCKCNSGSYAQNNQCFNICQIGYIQDQSGTLCVDDFCYSVKCQTCQNGMCTLCQSGYYLLNGQCIQSCPSYTTVSGQKCIDIITKTSYGQYLYQGMFSTYFGEGEISGTGLSYSGFQGYNANPSRAMTTVCGGKSLLGGAYLSSSNSYINKNFNGLAPHWTVLVGYTLYKIDNWNNESIQMIVDGQVKTTTTRTLTDGTSNICGRVSFKDQIIQVTQNFTHTATSLNLKISSTLASTPFVESYGIREMFILVDYCISNCAVCNAQGCTKCQTNLYLYNYQCVSQCPSGYAPDTSQTCQPCDATCLTCSFPQSSTTCKTCKRNKYLNPNNSCQSLFLENNQCVQQCSQSNFVKPNTNICYQCDSSCQTCSGPSSEECLLCSSNQILLNSKCYSECPPKYYTYQEQQTKECKLCNHQCKLGCSGPLAEDCDSIKFQYQIIFYILTGKCFLWCTSSILGYIMDKKQSCVLVETFGHKDSAESDKLDNFQDSPQIEDNSHRLQQNRVEEKSSTKFKSDIGSQQKQQDIINLEKQVLQFQMKIDLDKMKRVGNRRPRQKFYKNPFYDKSMQTFEFQLPSITLNMNTSTHIKNNDELGRIITNVPNLSLVKTQISGIQEVKITRPYIQKYNTNQILKFIILGNEWVSLFYFYDQSLNRLTRSTLIFLKYQAFFLSTELIYQILLKVANKLNYQIDGLYLYKGMFSTYFGEGEISATGLSYLRFQGYLSKPCRAMATISGGKNLLGGAYLGSVNSSINKSFTRLALVGFMLYKIDNWNNESVQMIIHDDVKATITRSSSSGLSNICGRVTFNDEIIYVTQNFTHSSKTLNLKINSKLSSKPFEKTYGIRELFILVDDYIKEFPSNYAADSNQTCQSCDPSCLTCSFPQRLISCKTCKPNTYLNPDNSCSNLFLENNQCVPQCSQSSFIEPYTNISQQCGSSFLTCSGLSPQEYTLCVSSLIFINSQCYFECPIKYYTQQDQQKKECKLQNYQCKLGCSGPLTKDCDSIKQQYQIIFYILIGKYFVWFTSSIFGYILDKKQSKVQIEAPIISFMVDNIYDRQSNNQNCLEVEEDI
ncbi:hypothetical protein ABPG72_015420 [Tetrahymena utriculariae]